MGLTLRFDRRGGYFFGELDAERRLKLEDEREELENRLRGVEEMERRVGELEGGGGRRMARGSDEWPRVMGLCTYGLDLDGRMD